MYFGPERKNQRLKEFDYSSFGFYFVTICTKNRENHFGEIIDGKMNLGKYGEIVEKEILKTPELRKEIKIDKFAIMPNHVHFIVEIKGNNDVRRERLQSFPTGAIGLKGNNLSSIIRGLKGTISKQINEINNNYKFAWQKSFYERIIRDENEYNQTVEYIENNPLKWEFDKNNIHP